MPHDRGFIFVDTTTTPHRGVEIADIMSVVPVTIKRTVNGVTEARSSADIGVLAGKSVGDEVPDNQGGAKWKVSSRIEVNPMAKYKPVRKDKKAALTDNDFKSVRYGLEPKGGVTSPSTFNSDNPDPDATWEYNKPRGKMPSNPNPQEGWKGDEWYRLTDFNGYFHRAAAPLAIEVSGELCNSVGVVLHIDSQAAEHNGGQWGYEYNLTMADIFNDISTPGMSSHLCVCIHNITEGHVQHCTVVSKKTAGELFATSGNEIVLYAEGGTKQDGNYYPSVDMLNISDRNGDDFRFIVGLVNNYTGGDNEYEVFDFAINVYPLAFKKGIDRKDVKLYLNDTIANLTARNLRSSITLTYNRTETHNRIDLTDGKKYDIYYLSGYLYGDFVTPSDKWSRPNGTVGIKGTITNARINPFIDSLDRVIATDFNFSGSAYIPNAGTSYPAMQIKSFSQEEVWFEQEVPQSSRYVVIAAWADNRNGVEKVYFENSPIYVYVTPHQ